jgi:hypothetical protein
MNNSECEKGGRKNIVKQGKIKQIVFSNGEKSVSGSFFLLFGIGGGSVGENKGKEYYSGYFYINDTEIKYLKFPVNVCSFVEDSGNYYEITSISDIDDYFNNNHTFDSSCCNFYQNCGLSKVVFHIPKNSILYNVDINLKRGKK